MTASSLLVGVLAAAAAASAACARAPDQLHVTWPDAPLQLADDADRDQAIDELAAMPRGATRDAARGRIAGALVHRLSEALDDDRPFIAEALLAQLIELWQDDPTAIGAGLAGQAPVLHRVRDTFSRSGSGEPAIAALVVLAELEPQQRAAHLAEIDEILAYADDLAVSERGPDAQRAQPIALLQPTVLALPVPWLVDRYVELSIERANAVAAVMARDGATIQLVRAQHDVLSTSHRIGNVLARAGRAGDIHAALERVHGIGNLDKDLASRADIVAEQPTANAYVELARALRDLPHAHDDNAAPDAEAALDACLSGLVKFPHDPDLLSAAAEHAQALGRVEQPIALLATALHAAPAASDGVLALRLGRLYAERIDRLAIGGRPGAATAAWHDLDHDARAADRTRPLAEWTEAEADAEAALGRGLIADGELADGERTLTSAIARAPSYDAYDALANLDLQVDRYASATRWVARGMALLGDSLGDRYRRAKLERVAGDAFRRANRTRDAAETYLDALRTWASLGTCDKIPRSVCAERMLDSGRIEWALGEDARGIELVQRAVDTDPDTPSTVAGAVAFLVEIGRPDDAAEAFHRSLGSADIGELTKVYASLWMVGDARRHGRAPDRQALEYLQSRTGDVWYELLAEAATGRADLTTLRAAATTGPRRAELDFYTATLGLDPGARPATLLERVVRSQMVTHAEYDLARVYLARP
nr:hypothetical protein [Kofleriaceae bacterium]